MFASSINMKLKQLLNPILNMTTRLSKSTDLSSNVRFPELDIKVNRIVWIDMEMTGLNIDEDKIMEVACLITDSELNVIAEGPEVVIHQPLQLLENMQEWCRNQHGKTGLTEACLKSETTINEAESRILQFVEEHITENASPLAGNSVYMDRLFLRKFMPKIDDYLHYRIIDVSSIKEVCRRWNPELHKLAPRKEFSHRALNDIRESVAELKFYKNNFFKTSFSADDTDNCSTRNLV